MLLQELGNVSLPGGEVSQRQVHPALRPQRQVLLATRGPVRHTRRDRGPATRGRGGGSRAGSNESLRSRTSHSGLVDRMSHTDIDYISPREAGSDDQYLAVRPARQRAPNQAARDVYSRQPAAPQGAMAYLFPAGQHQAATSGLGRGRGAVSPLGATRVARTPHTAPVLMVNQQGGNQSGYGGARPRDPLINPQGGAGAHTGPASVGATREGAAAPSSLNLHDESSGGLGRPVQLAPAPADAAILELAEVVRAQGLQMQQLYEEMQQLRLSASVPPKKPPLGQQVDQLAPNGVYSATQHLGAAPGGAPGYQPAPAAGVPPPNVSAASSVYAVPAPVHVARASHAMINDPQGPLNPSALDVSLAPGLFDDPAGGRRPSVGAPAPSHGPRAASSSMHAGRRTQPPLYYDDGGDGQSVGVGTTWNERGCPRAGRVEIFDGDGKTRLQEWLFMFKTARKSHDWSDADCVAVAQERTRGRAREVLMRLEDQDADFGWPALVAAMYAEFYAPAAVQGAHNVLSIRTQGPDETVRDYVAALEQLAVVAYPPITRLGSREMRDEIVLRQFIGHVRDAGLRRYLWDLQPRDLTSAKNLAENYIQREVASQVPAGSGGGAPTLKVGTAAGGAGQGGQASAPGKGARRRRRGNALTKTGDGDGQQSTGNADMEAAIAAAVKKALQHVVSSKGDGRRKSNWSKGAGGGTQSTTRRCDGKCFRCGRVGHFKRDCKSKTTLCVSSSDCCQPGVVCACACGRHLHFHPDSASGSESDQSLNEEGV